MALGYMGKILWVDLSEKKIWDETLDQKILDEYMGGYGIGLKLIYDRQAAKTDALDKKAIVGIITGPLTGTGSILGTRFTVCGKSPLTGTWGDANCGGYFGTYLKKSGYDGVMVTGESSQPVAIQIIDGEASLINASEAWGKETFSTEDYFTQIAGKGSHVACIGPAAERGNLFSAIITSKGRAAARCGLGAVWGAKKLKAIVVKGEREIPVASAELVEEYRKKYTHQIVVEEIGASKSYKIGTPNYASTAAVNGDGPIKNWKGAGGIDFTQEQAEKIDSEKLFDYRTKKYACYRCPLACSGLVKVHTEKYDIPETHQPEYETIGAFGANCCNSDLESIIQCNDICNRLGMDTISTGNMVAFAMECYEEGMINQDDTGSLELTWGNADAIVALTRMIGNMEGFGAVLGLGMEKAIKKIGKNSEDFNTGILGEPAALHDSRFEPALGIVYKMYPGKHIHASQFCSPVDFKEYAPLDYGVEREDTERRGGQTALLEYMNHIVNISGSCLFGYLSTTPDSIGAFLEAVTGKEWPFASLFEVGARISALRQAFNLREGINLVKEELPGRIVGDPPLNAGATEGFTVDMKALMKSYLDKMEWSLDGIPSKKLLAGLNLNDMANDLESLGYYSK